MPCSICSLRPRCWVVYCCPAPPPFQAAINSGNQLLIDFGPDGLQPGMGISLLLTLGKPGNNLFFPRLTFLG